VEAIIALPENMFYNTGIGTYIWVLSNNKAEHRKGKIQLIDATSLKSPLRKNLGNKNCELTPEIRRQIVDLYMTFEENEYSKLGVLLGTCKGLVGQKKTSQLSILNTGWFTQIP